MSLVKKIMKDIGFLVTGSFDFEHLNLHCFCEPSYALSNLYFNGKYIQGDVGILLKDKLVTTFESAKIYEDGKQKTVRNPCYCGLFINEIRYFHLADLLPAYLIKYHKPFYLFSRNAYGYYNGECLFTFYYKSIPHYVFKTHFEPTDELDKLLKLIGLADAYKRGCFKNHDVECIKRYTFLPYLYMAYYLKTKTTLLKNDLLQELERKLFPKYQNEIEIPENVTPEKINYFLKRIDLQILLIPQ